MSEIEKAAEKETLLNVEKDDKTVHVSIAVKILTAIASLFKKSEEK